MKTLQIIALVSLFIQPHKIVFDIPALHNKSIKEIKSVLGKPKYEDVPKNYQTQAGSIGDATFVKDGFILEVTYNPVNGKINDFFIGAANVVSDYKMLEEAGNLLKSNDFILSPVKYGKNQKLYTGVTVTPK